MPNGSADWFNQALRDLEQAEDSRKAERHEWADVDMKRQFTKMLRGETVWVYGKNEEEVASDQ